MKEAVEQLIRAAIQELYGLDIKPELTRPDEQFGDWATNVAMSLTQKVDNPPAGGAREVAEAIASKIQAPEIAKVEIAGPGFINLTLADSVLAQAVQNPISWPKINQDKQILVEFGNANPFKDMHIGHLYTAIVGEALARLLEASGAEVKRLSYHGDIGMHVAKWFWGKQQAAADKNNEPLGYYYALGSKAFEEDEAAANEIRELNDKIFNQDADIKDLYLAGRQLSFEQFDAIFNELGIHHDKRYLESETAKAGLEIVKENTGKIFEASDGAVVYKGERAGLHTRVFINSRGLPTYEAKDLGLIELKHKDFPSAAESIVITANEQNEYFKVMLAALNEIDANLASKTKHLSHGFLSLTTGKMNSRSGDVYAAKDLLESVHELVKAQYPDSTVQQETYLAAVKYNFLKHRLGGDIVFDVKESVSLEGNSGPYLQYTHARARSILDKASQPDEYQSIRDLQPAEHSLARKISEFSEVVQRSVAELMPHHIATYLYELAQTFNGFYEKNRVIGDEREAIRLKLLEAYAQVLKKGLEILGIPAPEKM